QYVLGVNVPKGPKLPKSFVITGSASCERAQDIVTHFERLLKVLRLDETIDKKHRHMERHLPIIKRVSPLQFVIGRGTDRSGANGSIGVTLIAYFCKKVSKKGIQGAFRQFT